MSKICLHKITEYLLGLLIIQDGLFWGCLRMGGRQKGLPH